MDRAAKWLNLRPTVLIYSIRIMGLSVSLGPNSASIHRFIGIWIVAI